jgi:hypothetical protein
VKSILSTSGIQKMNKTLPDFKTIYSTKCWELSTEVFMQGCSHSCKEYHLQMKKITKSMKKKLVPWTYFYHR